jgi:hypothetical protein
MKQSELLRLYSHMRTALFITVPIAGWGFTYWLSSGDALASVLIGMAITLPLFDILPSKAEISHSLMAERKRQENIWFKML